MNAAAVIERLESMTNPRGVESFKRIMKSIKADSPIRSVGLGVGQVKKLAKEIKRDHDRAMALWESNILEARLVAIFSEEPKKVTIEQAKEQIPTAIGFMVADYYCAELIIKHDYAFKLAEEWTQSSNKHLKKCGFAILYNMGRFKKGLQIPDETFIPYLHQIEAEILSEENWVKESMNYTLMYLGTRSQTLYEEALRIAEKIGPIEIDYGDTSCKTANTAGFLKNKGYQTK